MEAFGSLVVGLFSLAYAAYCMLNGGTHHRGKGWLAREEAPRGFLFLIVLYLVLGLSSLTYFLFSNIR